MAFTPSRYHCVGGADEIYERILDYAGEDHWLTAVSYPNFVRKEKLRYTKLQLVASFLRLASWNNLKGVEELREEAKKVGEFMHERDLKCAEFVLGTYNHWLVMIDNLYNSMSTLVEENYD